MHGMGLQVWPFGRCFNSLIFLLRNYVLIEIISIPLLSCLRLVNSAEIIPIRKRILRLSRQVSHSILSTLERQIFVRGIIIVQQNVFLQLMVWLPYILIKMVFTRS